MSADTRLTYKAAGVDIDAGEELVERIKDAVQKTRRPEVLGGIGGFGGLMRIPSGYRSPVLVSGTDGVGTKLKLAIEFDAHDGVGQDLVAMCANDILVLGAEPLFFLDYFVSPKLDVDVAARVIAGIAAGCQEAGAALIGGETAEHPGMHAAGEYDLAGFCVGIVEEDQIIDGQSIRRGDAVIGIASSGPHSNGFSLIRKALQMDAGAASQEFEGKPLIEHLLEPTRIYARSILALTREPDLKPLGLAHITGGGLTENIPRVLPAGLGAVLNRDAWPRHAAFQWLERVGVEDTEMHRTFNCGVGMVAIVRQERATDVVERLEVLGERAWIIGEIVADESSSVAID